MDQNHNIKITPRDRLLRAWQNSTELVRDFETASKEIEDDDRTASLFAEFAEDEALHASKLLELLRKYDRE